MNPTEEHTQTYFGKSNCPVIKIVEREIKTPDFEGDGILVEVKQLAPEEVNGLTSDSTYNALKNNLRDAARKFRSYDSAHTKKHIVVIYSNEIVKDDIYSVWPGEWSPEHKDKIFKGGMLLSLDHKKHIDAIAWFKKTDDDAPSYVWATTSDLKQYFPETNHE